MPTVGIPRDLLFEALGRSYSARRVACPLRYPAPRGARARVACGA